MTARDQRRPRFRFQDAVAVMLALSFAWTWMYRGRVLEGSGSFPAGAHVTTPTGVVAFPDPVFSPPPRSLAQKTYNIVHWRHMPAGGHFAALEQPELLLANMRRFFADITVAADVR